MRKLVSVELSRATEGDASAIYASRKYPLAILWFYLGKLNMENIGRAYIGMNLSDHQEGGFCVPMPNISAGTTVCSPRRPVFLAADRAFLAGAPFIHEARTYTGLLGLVGQVLFHPAILHLRNLLTALASKTTLLTCFLLYALGIANDEFRHIIGDAPVYRFA